MHERLNVEEKITPGSNRQFGYVFTVFFLLIAIFPFLHGNPLRLWPLPISTAFLIVTLTKSEWLTRLNYLWMRFGLLLHKIMNPLIMGLMFFIVITPFGLIRRMSGAETTLKTKFEPELDSYWIKRDPAGPAAQSYDTQF